MIHQRSNLACFLPTHRRAATRRGVALLLVLGVVAAASILGWAMLSASSMHAQVNENVSDSVASKYLADSGVSYAMYYLRYPEKSPVALTAGTYNNHYGGEYGLTLWSDAAGPVDIVVTNTALNTYLIRSTSIVNGITRLSEAEVVTTTTGYKVETAASFGGPITLPSAVSITGLVSTVGTVLNAVGTTLTSLGGSSITVSASATPKLSEILLINETGIVAPSGGDDRTYTIDGVTYVAEKAPATITGPLLTSRPALNPANVWYSDGTVELNGATLNGTLVIRDASKSRGLTGINTITAKSTKLPAVIVAGDTKQKHQTLKASKLTVNGVAWIGGSITESGTSLTAGFFNVQGSLLLGSTSPSISSGIDPMTIAHTVTVRDVKLTESNTITGITVTRWTRQ